MARLIEWARDGRAPPPSRFPSMAAGTLVAPTSVAMGFPALDALGMSLPASPNELSPIDHSVMPGRVEANRHYEVLVPGTDADGHDIAGIRGPDIEVPLATHTGFGLRKAGFAQGQLCGLNGGYLPLAKDAQARSTTKDPRPSIAERYATRSVYMQRIQESSERLNRDGLMLDEDVKRALEAAQREPRVQMLPP
jgi:hypothetical protein